SRLGDLEAEIAEAWARQLADPDEPTAELTGQGSQGEIDGYVLLEKLGEGGMGEVWSARQEQPIRRRVAIKLVRRGMDSGEMLRRFEVERQALALMDHPHIARVYAAGQTVSGRPYFAMELVSGVPITEFCDRHRLPTRERLGLFLA